MSTNIESNNQSGGITAHTVNVGSHISETTAAATPVPSAQASLLKRSLVAIGALIGVVAAVVQVLEYFGFKVTP